LLIINSDAVGNRNKANVGKVKIVPYCESFPYSEFSSFIKLNFVKHKLSVKARLLYYSGVSYCEFGLYFNIYFQTKKIKKQVLIIIFKGLKILLSYHLIT